MIRYSIAAKRKDKFEPWSPWTTSDNYNRAVQHACHVEELGYSSKIVASKEVEALWTILGKQATDETDAILDVGFRLSSVLAKEIFENISRSLDLQILKTEMELQVLSENKRKSVKKITCLNQEVATLQNIKVILNGLKRNYTEGDADNGGEQ